MLCGILLSVFESRSANYVEKVTIKSFFLFVFVFKWFQLKYFHKSLVANIWTALWWVGVFFCLFHIKLYAKIGGVSKPYFSVHRFRFNSFPFLFSHFLDLSFCFKNPKMSVPLVVPHECFLSWLPPTELLLSWMRGGRGELFGLGQGALTLAVVCVEQQSVSQWLLSKRLALWALISGEFHC